MIVNTASMEISHAGNTGSNPVRATKICAAPPAVEGAAVFLRVNPHPKCAVEKASPPLDIYAML